MLKLIMLPLLALCFVFVALLAVAGCAICAFAMRDEARRTVELSAPVEGTAAFAAEMHNGSIAATGADTAEYTVTATVKARAGSEERARELAEATAVALVPGESGVRLDVDKPKTRMNESINVHIDAVLPRETALSFKTHNGGVSVAEMDGDVTVITHNGGVNASHLAGALDAETHNGGINCTNCTGGAELKTYNGGIDCREAAGDVTAVTHNGGVDVAYSEDAGPVKQIVLETHNGSISLDAPDDFAGAVDIRSSRGSVRTDLPILLESFDRRSIAGHIGEGDGMLRLKTRNGSIRAGQAEHGR